MMAGYRHFASVARGMGVDFEIIDAAECARRHPLISPDNLLGGLWDASDGDIDPAQLCQALARRARLAGRRFTATPPLRGCINAAMILGRCARTKAILIAILLLMRADIVRGSSPR